MLVSVGLKNPVLGTAGSDDHFGSLGAFGAMAVEGVTGLIQVEPGINMTAFEIHADKLSFGSPARSLPGLSVAVVHL